MDIEKVKTEGIRKHLRQEISNRLWEAARFAENGRKEDFADFTACVRNARITLDEAVALHDELERMGDI